MSNLDGLIFRALILTSACLFPLPSYSAQYHVDAVSGNDSRTAAQAQSASTPWKTIQKASDNDAAGDTVIVHAGTYPERVTIPTDGAPGAGRITYVAQGQAVLRGFDI